MATRFRIGNWWWEKTLPSNAPIHSSNASYLTNMSSGSDSISFVGTGVSNTFTPALYQPAASDNLYHIVDNGNNCPAAFHRQRRSQDQGARHLERWPRQSVVRIHHWHQ